MIEAIAKEKCVKFLEFAEDTPDVAMCRIVWARKFAHSNLVLAVSFPSGLGHATILFAPPPHTPHDMEIITLVYLTGVL